MQNEAFLQHIMLDSYTAMLRSCGSYVIRKVSEDKSVQRVPAEFIEFKFYKKLPYFAPIKYGDRVFAALASNDDHTVLAGESLVLFDRKRRAVIASIELVETAISVSFVKNCIAVGLETSQILMLYLSDLSQQIQFSIPCQARQLFAYTNLLLILLTSGELLFLENFSVKNVVHVDQPLKQIAVAPYLQESELRILGLSWSGQVYYIDARGSRMIPTARRLVSIDTYIVGILTGMDRDGAIYLIDVESE